MAEKRSIEWHSGWVPNAYPKGGRDTDILEGKITFNDRQRITKTWNRAITLGPWKLLNIKQSKDEKRGWIIP